MKTLSLSISIILTSLVINAQGLNIQDMHANNSDKTTYELFKERKEAKKERKAEKQEQRKSLNENNNPRIVVKDEEDL
ncbi:hypothetical protein [Flammeovirga kamogawensis]|uniref:Secreted protein n=1 Tax=Flammeovirga kamogawensis TaxID=373891 RepID=A0ABX8H2A4_9BACT|nr:hypothetical protein [Flammeovirga kamogawensis]MBB6460147.1 hypothetical protein [Flammeovirga kamogawensis]QWG09960.1 hypothetical protein KM029_19965 [Flammeovirga kamogawensis]TRX65467.1 hypothetical protein EO216_23390 [Flammeovirga kamogawensis]